MDFAIAGQTARQAMRRERRLPPSAVGMRLQYGAPPPKSRPLIRADYLLPYAREPLAPHELR